MNHDPLASSLARASVAAVLALSTLAAVAPSAQADTYFDEDCTFVLSVAVCNSERYDTTTGYRQSSCTYVRDDFGGPSVGFCQYPGERINDQQSNTCVFVSDLGACDGGYGFCLAGRSDCDAPCSHQYDVNLCAKPGQTYCVRSHLQELVCDGGQSYCLATETAGCMSTCSGVTVAGQQTCVTSCPPDEQGIVINGEATCHENVFTSCTGTDNGIVVLGEPACARLCDSGSGAVVNGDPECHTVALCPSGTYGVQVDGSGCHTVTVCPSGSVGAHVDSVGACVPYSIPTVGLCPNGSYGVVVNGDPECHAVALCPSGTYGVKLDGSGCHTVAVCGSGTYGVAVDGSGCHTVEVCSGDTLGVKVDGSGCVENTVTDACPNGRKGVVVAGEEICPLA